MAKAAAKSLLDDQGRLGDEYGAELHRVTTAALTQGLMVQERLVVALDFAVQQFVGNGASREQLLEFVGELFDAAKKG